MRAIAIALGLLSALIWGAHSSVSVLAISQGWTIFDITATRVAGGLLISLPWFLWQLSKRKEIPWLKALALTCFAGVPFSLINIAGLQFAPVTHGAAISLGMVPVLAGLLSKPILGQAVSRDHWLALLLILSGIGAIWIGTSISWRYALGDLCFLIGALLWALYAIYLRHWAIKPAEAAFYTSLGSAPYLIWYALDGAWPDSSSATIGLQLVYQGMIVGVLAVFFYGKTVSVLGPQLGSLFSALPPVIVPVVAGMLLDYQSDSYEYIGITLVITGMLIAFFKPLQFQKPDKL